MKARQLLIVSFIAVVAMAFCQSSFAKERVVFGGGPAGGTFQVVANAVQVYGPIKDAAGYKVQAQSSAGDTENLRKLNSNKVQLSISYSGSVWKARNGKMPGDTTKYDNIMAVAWLYGAPAQLVVKKDSGIKSTKDLAGKKVGVGNAGSGAFANCELFFRHMGVWDKIERNAMGYNDAAQAFGNNQLDAFWLFTAAPSGAVIMAAQTNDIAMIDLNADAEASGLYKEFPYFAVYSLPAGTYKGVDTEIKSFQDSAIWTANKDLSADIVYDILSKIYTEDGIKHMAAQNKNFKGMSIKTGPMGIVTPFHPGAEKFWKETGVL
ncbi:MAG: TAXI family TRAP transporter solute-binding subunit [Pseudomonadota bacterium]